jgi:hypothetical protein
MIEIKGYYAIERSYDSNLFRTEHSYREFQLDIDFKALNNKILQDYDLSEVKKINIAKGVNFPRFKIKDSEQFQTCLAKNAEVIIMEKVEAGNSWPRECYVYQGPSDEYYLFSPWNSGTIKQALHVQDLSEDDIFKFLVSRNIIPTDSKNLGKKKIRTESKKTLDKIRCILNADKPLIDKSVLEHYLASSALTPDQESLDNIVNLLKSKDTNSICLAIDMLMNFDIVNNRLAIYDAIKPHVYDMKIRAYAKLQSAAWRNILDMLGFSNTSSLESMDIRRAIRNIYNIANNETDKEAARQRLIAFVNDDIERVKMSNDINNYNINVEYNVE